MERPSATDAKTMAELEPLLASALSPVDAELRAQVIQSLRGVLDEHGESSTSRGKRRLDRSLNEENTYYIVHDTDLQLLKASVSLAISFLPVFKPLTALPALIALLYRYRRMRARIDSEQAAVLLCLRNAPPGGSTLEEITSRLALRSTPSSERVLEILHSLRNVELANGTLTSFVAQSGDVWLASDV